MAKKGKNKAPKRKKPQSWNFTDSQKALVQEQAKVHNQEQQPLLAYQAQVRAALLNSFLKELGIKPNTPLTVNLDTWQFIAQD